MIEIEVEPPMIHRCGLPQDEGGYKSTDRPIGTIVVCDCGRAWVSRPCFEHYGPTTKWYRVHWWHFTLRRRIREATR